MSEFTATHVASLPQQIVYLQREDRRENWLDRLGVALEGFVVTRAPSISHGRPAKIVRQVNARRARFEEMTDDDLRQCGRQLRQELRRQQMHEAAIGRCFALVREVSQRAIGLRHFDVQLIGGMALLKGTIVEMETGEGKTLTATLPAVAAALGGINVHIVTVNDYLAQRDADWMGPIYRFLGLTVGIIKHGMSHEAKQAAYGCDVAYCTNKELAFDYLRDRMLLAQNSGNLQLKLERLYGDDSRTRRLLLPGLQFAIVDEADSIMIDEARTPLIISGPSTNGDEETTAVQALALVDQLRNNTHYRIHLGDRRIELTDRGKLKLQELGPPLGQIWKGTILREEMARLALTAQHLFHQGEHYLVRDGKIQIVDEYTGRIMEDRYWSEGLHQLIEVKEGCEISGRRPTLARITYQRFFRRYERLSGMTGTASEVSWELWSVFRLPVIRVSTNKPLRRFFQPDQIFETMDQKWRAITKRISQLHDAGRPVLLGTRSVAASELASHCLTQAGLPHVVLSAAQDGQEAEIISQAGNIKQITVATNMAGRGTDIKLAPGVADLGGLCVILTERHDAARIDRQLSGRCGRQGEPGTVEAFYSLEDPLLATEKKALAAVQVINALFPRLGRWFGAWALRHAQSKMERRHSRARRDLLKLDRSLGETLAFSGKME